MQPPAGGIKTADAESLVITRIGSNAARAHANCLPNLFGVTVQSAIADFANVQTVSRTTRQLLGE
jgi:hypothetical protein